MEFHVPGSMFQVLFYVLHSTFHILSSQQDHHRRRRQAHKTQQGPPEHTAGGDDPDHGQLEGQVGDIGDEDADGSLVCPEGPVSASLEFDSVMASTSVRPESSDTK